MRGLNDKKKRGVIKGCICRWKPDVVCLQETKMEEVNQVIINDLWHNRKVKWEFLPTVGAAGGVVIMWVRDKLNCKETEIGRVSLTCLFEQGGGREPWAFSGMYCRGTREEKDWLWSQLHQCKNRWGGDGWWEEILTWCCIIGRDRGKHKSGGNRRV